MIDAADIKRMVPMDTVLGWYGLEPNRSGFLACPFHEDKDPSFKVYPGDRGWHCFSCDTGGSVIDLVMRMEGMTFSEACKAITDRSGLGGATAAPIRYRRKLEQSSLEKKKEAIRQQYIAARDILREEHDDFNDRLVWACQNIAHLEYLMENLDDYKG